MIWNQEDVNEEKMNKKKKKNLNLIYCPNTENPNLVDDAPPQMTTPPTGYSSVGAWWRLENLYKPWSGDDYWAIFDIPS